jgi:hypothetical protein
MIGVCRRPSKASEREWSLRPSPRAVWSARRERMARAEMMRIVR